jgi:hypothetical protein
VREQVLSHSPLCQHIKLGAVHLIMMLAMIDYMIRFRFECKPAPPALSSRCGLYLSYVARLFCFFSAFLVVKSSKVLKTIFSSETKIGLL